MSNEQISRSAEQGRRSAQATHQQSTEVDRYLNEYGLTKREPAPSAPLLDKMTSDEGRAAMLHVSKEAQGQESKRLIREHLGDNRVKGSPKATEAMPGSVNV